MYWSGVEQSTAFLGPLLYNFFTAVIYECWHKIECLSISSLSSLVNVLRVRLEANPEVERLKGPSLRYALAVLPNIRLSCKGLAGHIRNIYNLKRQKSYKTSCRGANVTKLFTAVLNNNCVCPGKPFQPNLMFSIKAYNLPKNGASFSRPTWVGSGLDCKL